MKILIVVPSLPPAGGAEQVAWELAKELAKSNETHLLTFNDKEFSIENNNVMIHFLPKTKHTLRYYSTVGQKKIITIVDKIQPEVIHAHMVSILAYILRKSKLKTILTIHNSELIFYNKTLLEKLKHNLFTKQTIKDFDVVTTISNQMKNYFTKFYKREINYIPNGIDINKFQKLEDIKRDDKLILYVGRLTKNKRVEIIFELAKKMPDYRFIIIGDGPLKNSVNLPNLKFLGKKQNEELPLYYNKAGYSIFPSMIENMPLVGLEAMACGSIVISSTKGFSEYIDDGINGFIFNKPDMQNIMNVIKYTNNRNSIRSMAFTKAKTYSWQLIMHEYNYLYMDGS
jgi:L-malate glycosyltransferase